MKKSAILLAGAVAFDLGVMVVPGHAAVDAYMKMDIHKSAPQADYFLKIEFLKLDGIEGQKQTCRKAGGEVYKLGSQFQCQFPQNHGRTHP